MKIYFLILSLFITLGSNAQITAPANQPEKVKEFSNDDYQFQYPEDWKLETSMQANGVIYLFCTEPDQSQQTFTENVNVMKQDLTGMDLDLPKFVQLSKDQLGMFLTDVQLEVSENFKHKGIEMHRMAYSGILDGERLGWVQHYTIQDEQAYLITQTYEFGKENKLAEGTVIFDTFQLKSH